MNDKILNQDRTSELWQAVKDRSLPVKEKTKAEYESLPEEEKNNGLYFIPDANPTIPPDSSSTGSSSLDVYSTEETRIGTWIDGKPLYRKVISYNLPSTQDEEFDSGIKDLDKLVSATGYVNRLDGGQDAIPNVYYYIAHLGTSNNFHISIYTNYYYGAQTTIIVEYTKTTD